MKRIVIGLVLLLVIAAIALALLARSVLTGDNVRAAVEAQVSKALGQPVTVGSIAASVYPRVTMDLTDVTIGQPARIRLASMRMATGLRALLSRRIEHATIRIDGARLLLPLPEFGTVGRDEPRDAPPASSPVEIVSVDEIVLRDVEVVGGERTLRGDVELVPQGKGVQIRRIALTADGTQIEMSGVLTSLSPIEGRVDAKAAALDLDRLVAFLTDFTVASVSARTVGSGSGSSPAPGFAGRLTFALSAERVTTGGLELSDLDATALVLPGTVTFEPLTFGVFAGRYEGTMGVALGRTPQFRWRAAVSGIDTAALMAFAGSPGTITGALAGQVALEGTGFEMEQALRTAHGTARVDISNGTIAGLSLVRTIVTAGSGRGGLLSSAGTALTARGDSSGSERFSRLGATLSLAAGRMTTKDLAMTSTDVDLQATGTIALQTMIADFDGRVQLSEQLSKEAGTDLYRYAQVGGRVTLPVEVAGPIGNLTVHIDLSEAAKRAIRNRAADEAKKALEKNLRKALGGLIRKKGGQP